MLLFQDRTNSAIGSSISARQRCLQAASDEFALIAQTPTTRHCFGGSEYRATTRLIVHDRHPTARLEIPSWCRVACYCRDRAARQRAPCRLPSANGRGTFSGEPHVAVAWAGASTWAFADAHTERQRAAERAGWVPSEVASTGGGSRAGRVECWAWRQFSRRWSAVPRASGPRPAVAQPRVPAFSPALEIGRAHV